MASVMYTTLIGGLHARGLPKAAGPHTHSLHPMSAQLEPVSFAAPHIIPCNAKKKSLFNLKRIVLKGPAKRNALVNQREPWALGGGGCHGMPRNVIHDDLLSYVIPCDIMT